MQQKYTWAQLCDLTVKNLEKQLDMKNDEKKFRKWFMAREKVGWRFDHWMIYRMFEVWKELESNLDHFIVNSGREGFGKSTLAANQACWVDPDFILEGGMIYEIDDYINIMIERQKEIKESIIKNVEVPWKVIILDEGTELLSSDSQNTLAKEFQKIMLIQRVLKFCVIINIPNFFMLNSNVRLHRVRTLIETIDKGNGWFFGDRKNRSIQIISAKGTKLKHIEASWVPVKWKRLFNFRMKFPDTIDYRDYLKHKIDGVGRTLDTIVANRLKKLKKEKTEDKKKA